MLCIFKLIVSNLARYFASVLFISITSWAQTPNYSVQVSLLKPNDNPNQGFEDYTQSIDAATPQTADLQYFGFLPSITFRVLLRGHAETGKGWAASSSANLVWDNANAGGSVFAGSSSVAGFRDHLTIARQGWEGRRGIATIIIHSQTVAWGTEGVGGASYSDVYLFNNYRNGYVTLNEPVEIPFGFGEQTLLDMNSHSFRGTGNWLGSGGGSPHHFYSLPWVSSNSVSWGGILSVRLEDEPEGGEVDLDSLVVTSSSGFDYKKAATPVSLALPDGILRPEIHLRKREDGAFVIDFTGTLESSDNLQAWTRIDPQPESPYIVPPSIGMRFFRASVEME